MVSRFYPFVGIGVTGGSGSVSGIVDSFASLPDPTTKNGSFYLVRNPSGVYLINRKPRGLYYSDGIKWLRAPDITPYFSDANIEIYNSSDNTKAMGFDTSAISPTTKRILSMPDQDVDLGLMLSDIAGKEPAFTKNTAFNKNFGSVAGTVTEGNDPRLSDSRTPINHASSHVDGTDDIQNATTTQKGLATPAQINQINSNTSLITNHIADTTVHIFGTEPHYIEDTTISSTLSTTWISKLILNTNNLPLGQYRFAVTYNWNYNSTTRDFEARLLLNGVVYPKFSHRQEPKDSAGTFDTTGTNQKHIITWSDQTTLSGVNTIDLQFRSTSAGIRSSMWNTKIELWRIT